MTSRSSVRSDREPDAPRALDGPRQRWWPILLLVAIVPPVALLTAQASGAMQPLDVADPGTGIRVATVVTRSLQHAAAAATIGLLLVAAFITPEGRRTHRRATAAQMASVSAALWVAAAACSAVLEFTTLSGLEFGAAGYWESFTQNMWRIQPVQLPLLQAGLALFVIVAAVWARTRGALAWTFALAIVALLPISFGGHAAGSDGHEQAVTAMMIHLIAVCLWVGGLIALIALRRTLGPALEICVRRYSTIALCSFIAVGGSGVLFSILQADSLDDLTSPYWVVLWAKVAALVVLGGFGVQQRRLIIRRGVHRKGAFVRLAVVESVVMAVTTGLAVALGRTPPPVGDTGSTDIVQALSGFPEPPPYEASVWFTTWRIDWLFTLIAVAAIALYLAGAIRLWRRGDRWPISWTVLWVIGWLLFMVATSGAPGVYGRIMFSMHMVQHMALMMLIPIFLVLGSPITLALRALPSRSDKTLGPREIVLGVVHSRWAKIIANPVVAAGIFFGSLVAFYWTGLFEWALTTHVGHAAMTIHFTLAGYAFVWSLIGRDPGPPKWSAPLRLLVLFATLAAHAFFGLALAQGRWLLAPGFFVPLELSWVPDLLADQQLGGTIAWGIGEMPTLALALLVTRDWFRTDRREAVRSDRQADRDNDAALTAYNERLAAISQRDRGAAGSGSGSGSGQRPGRAEAAPPGEGAEPDAGPKTTDGNAGDSGNNAGDNDGKDNGKDNGNGK